MFLQPLVHRKSRFVEGWTVLIETIVLLAETRIYLRIIHTSPIFFLQGLSTGIDIFWRPWRPTINNFLVKMNVSVYFWGFGIWVSATKFWKNYIGWPQQPPSERVPYISEKLDFWWSIPKKMTIIGHFGAIDDQTIRIKIIFEGIEL